MTTTIYTRKEMCKTLKVSARTLDGYVLNGKINSTKIGRFRRFTQKHLDEFLLSGEV